MLGSWFVQGRSLLYGQHARVWNRANRMYSSVVGFRTPVGPTAGNVDEEPVTTNFAVTENGSTIVCLHSSHIQAQVVSSNARPLQYKKLTFRRNLLSEAEQQEVKMLRKQDPSLWTVSTLARMFNVKPTVISRVAPITSERKQQLDELSMKLSRMKAYKRHTYKTELEKIRQERLKKALDARERHKLVK